MLAAALLFEGERGGRVGLRLQEAGHSTREHRVVYISSQNGGGGSGRHGAA